VTGRGDNRSGEWTPGAEAPEALPQSAGLELMLALFSLLRTAAIHDINNRALDRPTQRTLTALEHLFGDRPEEVRAVLADNQFYVNDARIVVPDRQYQILRELSILFEDREVGGIRFKLGSTAEHLRHFAFLFHHCDTATERGERDSLEKALSRLGIETVGPLPPVRASVGGAGEDSSARVQAAAAYTRAVAAISVLLSDPAGSRYLTRAHLRRIVHRISDCASEALDYLIGLTEVVPDQDSIPRTLVDTCVVAVAVARSMQLDRSQISDLGAATLAIWGAETAAPAEVDEDPMAVLKELSHQERWTPSLLRRVVTAAERRQPLRQSGGSPAQYPLARIYRAAYDFVALTHGRHPETGESIEPRTAYEALSAISNAPPHVYDAVVVRHLVRVVGLYPAGTYVLLADGRSGYTLGRADGGHNRVRIREAPGQLGDVVTTDDPACGICAVLTGGDAAERAGALLSPGERDAIAEIGSDIANRATLARVRLRRVTAPGEPPKGE
jgi:hypothetical protein